jgi:3-phosphoshikimate 1-carboxyvinyltransferase
VEAVADHERCGEPVGTITGAASKLHGITLTEQDLPAVIDEVPIVAVAATQAHGRTSITGAAELRVKESDRIAVLERGLTTLGAKVEAVSDGLVIEGPTRLTGGVVDARSDHRMAMAFRIASLVASGPVKVEGSESVGTSFPGFAATLAGARATA